MLVPLSLRLLPAACLAAAVAVTAAAQEAAPAPPAAEILQPLVTPGRSLQFRGRSRHRTSHADLAPHPQIAFALSRFTVLKRDSRGWLVLDEQTDLFAADGESMDRLDSPRERRSRTIRVQPADGRLEADPILTTPSREGVREPRTLELTRTDDGFGLNAAARAAAGLPTLVVPAELYEALARDETVTRQFDFWLVRGDPREDRLVVPLDGRPGDIPTGAEGRVRGSTRLRPRGRQSFHLNYLGTAAAKAEGESAAVPVRRLAVTALAVAVRLELTMEWLPGPQGSIPPPVQRQDRMTWVVLDRAEEPWILEMDGSVELTVGGPPDATMREAYLTRRLDLVSEGSP